MSTFKIVPEIHTFDTLDAFIEAFSVNEKDLILTDRCLYEPFLAGKDIAANIIIQDDFGPGEPNSDKVVAIMAEAAKRPYDRVIAIGGGSVCDIGKLLVLKAPTDLLALFQGKEPVVREKKLVMLPTTCGTGSEITNISIVAFYHLGTKLGLAKPELHANDAVLVPELLSGLPYRVFLHSSIDAMIHAMESYLNPRSNEFTRFFSVDAIKTILKGYKALAENGEGYKNQLLKPFLMASTFAGCAFSNAGCGAVHAMSYSLSGEYHLPHGEANYECLIAVFQHYLAKNPDGSLKDLLCLIADVLGCQPHESIDALGNLLSTLIPRRPMGTLGMTEEHAPLFAQSVEETQQRLLGNAYVPMTVPDMTEIYKKIL
ncbi:MAG: 4-hydroxybutyrate dehydrogenase [Christensenellaceae bacterium]|nr:4-hydroxybutyrate dehydrogenase [Christensenellaceae bacterium]